MSATPVKLSKAYDETSVADRRYYIVVDQKLVASQGLVEIAPSNLEFVLATTNSGLEVTTGLGGGLTIATAPTPGSLSVSDGVSDATYCTGTFNFSDPTSPYVPALLTADIEIRQTDDTLLESDTIMCNGQQNIAFRKSFAKQASFKWRVRFNNIAGKPGTWTAYETVDSSGW